MSVTGNNQEAETCQSDPREEEGASDMKLLSGPLPQCLLCPAGPLPGADRSKQHQAGGQRLGFGQLCPISRVTSGRSRPLLGTAARKSLY